MRLSIIVAPFKPGATASMSPVVPVFGESTFICYGEDGSTYDLILCGDQYYVCGFDCVDFNRPASPVYVEKGRKMCLVGFEI